MLAGRWANEPDYSHGFLVPAFAIVLLWLRREMVSGRALKGSWLGVGLIAVAATIRFASAYYYYELVDPVSLIPLLAGLALLIGGWTALRWSWPAIAFLIFMIPLPGFAAELLSHPLQRITTIASTYALQTIGLPAVSQGNVIVLTEAKIGIVEACSGLRLMMLFFAVSVGVALLSGRVLWEKVLIVLSAIPIAMSCNLIRITVTGILHETVGAWFAEIVFHDLAGWLMMPLAIGMLWLELWLLSVLLIPRHVEGPIAPAV